MEWWNWILPQFFDYVDFYKWLWFPNISSIVILRYPHIFIFVATTYNIMALFKASYWVYYFNLLVFIYLGCPLFYPT